MSENSRCFVDTVLSSGESLMNAYDARKVVEMATMGNQIL